MKTSSSSPVSQSVVTAAERAIEAPELIDRLALDMRMKSGIDLPHAYFVEQVKLKLSGKTVSGLPADGKLPANDRKGVPCMTSSVFEFWALPESHSG
jgi:hypothetical protein